MKVSKNKRPVPLSERVIALFGGSSVKGLNILQRLENDPRFKHIIVLDRKKPPIETHKTKFYKLDLRQTLADVRIAEIFKKEKVHTVIHAGIPITPPRNQALSHEIISVGSMYICNACVRAGGKKLLLSSTTDVYGAFPDNPNFLTEESHARGGIRNRFLGDKIDAERAALRMAKKHPEMTVTIIRPCHILGPTIQSYKTEYLSRPIILTILGYDPLVQFVHENDVIDSYIHLIEKDAPGIFNIVGQGVLPLSRVIRILGKIHLPLPELVAKNLVQLIWYADMSPASASYLNFLKYLCVADGEKAKIELLFVPKYSTRETLLSFVGAERLRGFDLLNPETVYVGFRTIIRKHP